MPYPLVRLVMELALPPLGPFVLLTLAFFMRPRLPRLGQALGASAMVWMLAFSLPGTYRWLDSPWPTNPEVVAPPYPAADAIVVLGADRYLAAPEYGGDTAGPSTLERVRYAAKLQRETGLPLLVSGGNPGDVGQRSEAGIMRDILEQEFEVPVRWVEPHSTNTRENAQRSSTLLRADRVGTILLVTHQAHMARAASEFEATGLNVVPMPTRFRQPEADSIHLWIPSFYGLAQCRRWLQEQLAPLWPG